MSERMQMKERPRGFLRDEVISHDSETFDYIYELHTILWRFVNGEIAHASGNLNYWIPLALEKAELRKDDSARR